MKVNDIFSTLTSIRLKGQDLRSHPLFVIKFSKYCSLKSMVWRIHFCIDIISGCAFGALTFTHVDNKMGCVRSTAHLIYLLVTSL